MSTIIGVDYIDQILYHLLKGVEIVCPDDMRTLIDKGSTTAHVTWLHPAVYGGLNEVNVTGSYRPGDEFTVGIHDVQYIVYGSDTSPITACNFTVVVYGKETCHSNPSRNFVKFC